ncbi:hypothetical protein [Streptosporangium sp. NPDC006930]|uniref:hypothetical protein n=1 Tax=Streptosporangium sp. NPDC006930 TaxID=3154783 RepID=UPI0034305372
MESVAAVTSGTLIVCGAQHPAARRVRTLNSRVHTLFEVAEDPERPRRAVAFVDTVLTAGSSTPL